MSSRGCIPSLSRRHIARNPALLVQISLETSSCVQSVVPSLHCSHARRCSSSPDIRCRWSQVCTADMSSPALAQRQSHLNELSRIHSVRLSDGLVPSPVILFARQSPILHPRARRVVGRLNRDTRGVLRWSTAACRTRAVLTDVHRRRTSVESTCWPSHRAIRAEMDGLLLPLNTPSRSRRVSLPRDGTVVLARTALLRPLIERVIQQEPSRALRPPSPPTPMPTHRKQVLAGITHTKRAIIGLVPYTRQIKRARPIRAA